MTMKIGIIGCGNIFDAYMKGCALFRTVQVVACADINMAAAQAKATEHKLQAMTVDALLADPSIRAVINLTIPSVHGAVSLKILHAVKHVYSEKPLALNVEEGRKILDCAREKNLKVGCAPDTFLGAGLQTCRRLIDDGWIGRPLSGTAFMMARGPESWHPNPAFFYRNGAGPMLDMGPYYITDLVNLLGPVAKVQAMSLTPQKSRPIRSEPKKGQMMPVKVFTHVTGTLQFVSGALIQVTLSFDVPKHSHMPYEIFGSEGSMLVPDPNWFGGEVKIAKPRAEAWDDVPVKLPYADANYRSLGVADMAHAILSGRPHRASGDLALHVLEVMEAFETASKSGEIVKIKTRVERPAPMAESLKRGKIS